MLIWNIPFTLSNTGKDGALYRWHPIYVWGTGRVPHHYDVLSVNCEGRHWWDHPATKPIDLMRILVGFTDGTILDPFCGSGTTLVAGKLNGNNFIGIDIEKKYCDIAEERLRNTTPPLPFVQEKMTQGALL
jgi:DNA modification methylase